MRTRDERRGERREPRRTRRASACQRINKSCPVERLASGSSIWKIGREKGERDSRVGEKGASNRSA